MQYLSTFVMYVEQFKKFLNYNKNNAIKTKTNITATVPHKTNFVKLFQVFLWFSLSIKLLLSCFKFWISLIYNINSTSSSYELGVKVSFFN